MADRVKKRSLSVVDPGREGLGQPTIMDRGLAALHGTPYVHLAVFAIDVDRVFRELDAPLPLGWEIQLCVRYLARVGAALDPRLIEDACRSAMAQKGDVLGTELPFAIDRAVRIGVLPSSLAALFRGWRDPPHRLLRALDDLEAREPAASADSARACLAHPLRPPLAEPTADALHAIVGA
jgi:hypothetical protein